MADPINVCGREKSQIVVPKFSALLIAEGVCAKSDVGPADSTDICLLKAPLLPFMLTTLAAYLCLVRKPHLCDTLPRNAAPDASIKQTSTTWSCIATPMNEAGARLSWPTIRVKVHKLKERPGRGVRVEAVSTCL